MSYHGFEVFFLYLNNADSILIRHYDQGVKTVILIDGGRKKHVPVVRKFLKDLGENELHHLICSHHHEDHAGGLVDLVGDNTLTIRNAWVHFGDLLADRIDRSRFAAFGSLLRRIQASKETQKELVEALLKRGITPQEPFATTQIGPLLLVSPTNAFYNAQLEMIRQEAVAKGLNELYLQQDLKAMLLKESGATKAQDEEEDDKELGADPTSPENEVSTILLLPWTGTDGSKKHFLFTGDAGTAALNDLMTRSKSAKDMLRSVKWMQLPHHGSRRNMSIELFDYYKPETGFVSAEGSKKHPSVKLVNAVKERNGRVFSTHYPPEKTEGIWLRQTEGIVPEISTTPVKPLWDAPQ